MLFIFTGNGKGKTTAALGMAARALGAKQKVALIQFLKTGQSSELKALARFPNFIAKSFGRAGFFLPESILAKNPGLRECFKPFGQEDKILAQQGLFLAKKIAQKADLLILDEFNLVFYYGLLNRQKALEFLQKYAKISHIVLTGRYCSKALLDIADLATECREIKHYYHQNHKLPEKGIEL